MGVALTTHFQREGFGCVEQYLYILSVPVWEVMTKRIQRKKSVSHGDRTPSDVILDY